MPIEKEPAYAFEPSNPDPRHLRAVFEANIPYVDTEKLFSKLDELPEDLRLYFLAIIYWLHRSEHCDLVHLHALILSLLVLRTIDVKIPAEREVKAFRKRFGKTLLPGCGAVLPGSGRVQHPAVRPHGWGLRGAQVADREHPLEGQDIRDQEDKPKCLHHIVSPAPERGLCGCSARLWSPSDAVRL